MTIQVLTPEDKQKLIDLYPEDTQQWIREMIKDCKTVDDIVDSIPGVFKGSSLEKIVYQNLTKLLKD